MRRSCLALYPLLLTAFVAGCGRTTGTTADLLVATTTSTYDSGLLDAILPTFESSRGVEVDVVAVGTGQALEFGKSGDVDVVLVHNRDLEEAFVAAGHGVERRVVMFNDFVLVGAPEDRAQVSGAATAAEAFRRIYQTRSIFVSRGDASGTYARELVLWEQAGVAPTLTDEWYRPIGQGMGETLRFADEQAGYTLTDRATFLAVADSLRGLALLFGGRSLPENPDPALLNLYGVIQVTPEDPLAPRARLAADFVDWLTSLETQEAIAAYGVERFGQPLFYPASDAWCAASEGAAMACADR